MTDPRIGTPRQARASAAVGIFAWSGAVLALRPAPVAAVLLLATFVLVPAAVALLFSPAWGTPVLYRAVVIGQPFGAAGSLLAVAAGPGLIGAIGVVPWLVTMVLLAGYGTSRVLDRGASPLAAVLVDAGTVYGVVGPGSYLLYVLGIDLGFSTTILRLTAAHFHYAGLFLPVVGGLAGRLVADGPAGRSYRVGAWVVLGGMPVVAVGITLSRLVGLRVAELFGASLFATGAVLLAAVLVGMALRPGRVAKREIPVPARAALLVAGCCLAATMTLAAGYGYARAVDPGLLSIPTMIRYHGIVNAFGFAPAGLLAWHLTPSVRGPVATPAPGQVSTSTS